MTGHLIDPEALLADLAEYRKVCASKGLPLKAAAVLHTMTVVKRQRRVVTGPVVASVAPKKRAAQVKSFAPVVRAGR